MEELLGEIDRILDAAIVDAEAIQSAALLAINAWLEKASGPGGILVSDEATASIIASAKTELERAFQGTAYARLKTGILDSFGEIIENAKSIHLEVNELTITDAFERRELAPARRLAVERASAYLSSASLGANVVGPLTKVMFEAVQYGYTITEAQKAIASRMNFAQYIGQIARDSLFQFDGAINKAIADEYGLDGISYRGSLVRDSRGQCAKWVAMGDIPLSSLESEIAWAKRPGEYEGRKKSGMIPETNTNNFIVYRGGYNCRHRAIPVKLK